MDDSDGPDDLPRSPTGRVPQWVLDERLNGPAPETGWRTGGFAPPPPPRRPVWRRALSVLLPLALICTVGGGAAFLLLNGNDRLRGTSPGARSSAADGSTSGTAGAAGQSSSPGLDNPLKPPVLSGDPAGTGDEVPPPGVGEAAAPLGTPPATGTGSRSYAFLSEQDDGGPVAYDPCRSIHYVVRPEQAPKGGQALITEAVARVSQATGLRFVYDGSTTELPGTDRSVYQPDRYGERWAPVLIAWRTAKQYPGLKGDVAGEGGSVAYSEDGKPTVYTSGMVVLDAPDLTEALREPGGRFVARAVVMHELGHVVGLDHVEDEKQIMNPSTVPGQDDWGDGDRAGLAALGRGACAPWL